MVRPAAVAELLGRRLRALRKLRDLTQEELGERARVSAKFIGLVERGQANPSGRVASIAHAPSRAKLTTTPIRPKSANVSIR